MSNFKYLCVCELEECKLFLETPISLPCGYTICQKHVEGCQKHYKCKNCKVKHEIPNTGFPINNFALKTIESCVHLNDTQKRIAESLDKLEKIIKEHERLDSQVIVYDSFFNLRNQVDLHREELIEQINKRSDEIIKQLKEMEDNCRSNAEKLDKLKLDRLKNEDISMFRRDLRVPDLDDYNLNELYCDVNDLIDDIQNDIVRYNHESLMGKTVRFEKQNNNLFGELKVEEIKKPIRIRPNRSHSTFKLVINDFSKFKESKETRLSINPLVFRKLEWRIQAKSTQLDNGSFVLSFYLYCNGNNRIFPIWVNAKLKVLHPKDPTKNRFLSNISF